MNRQALVRAWLVSGLEAVDPESVTAAALAGHDGDLGVVAIGKAAAAMCRGAARAASSVHGVCISSHEAEVPDGIELIVGDHPVPGERSLQAGRRALEAAATADIALLSGGGSALCEVPRPGIAFDFVAQVHDRLISGGASIEEANLVRAHLSEVKSGGLGPLRTLIISDVSGAGPEIVASGPTLPIEPRPDRVLQILSEFAIQVPPSVENSILGYQAHHDSEVDVTILADGMTAAEAIADHAGDHGIPTHVRPEWIKGNLEPLIESFVNDAGSGVTVAAGEPMLDATGGGSGGRNTHTALMAAQMLAGSDWIFAALATDGADGSSGSAGAIVDGSTVERGGDPRSALDAFDSATYLAQSGDLLVTGPTGTNVADIWLIWKPE